MAAFRAERNRIWGRMTELKAHMDKLTADEWVLRRQFTHEHQLSHFKTIEEQILDWENGR